MVRSCSELAGLVWTREGWSCRCSRPDARGPPRRPLVLGCLPLVLRHVKRISGHSPGRAYGCSGRGAVLTRALGKRQSLSIFLCKLRRFSWLMCWLSRSGRRCGGRRGLLSSLRWAALNKTEGRFAFGIELTGSVSSFASLFVFNIANSEPQQLHNRIMIGNDNHDA